LKVYATSGQPRKGIVPASGLWQEATDAKLEGFPLDLKGWGPKKRGGGGATRQICEALTKGEKRQSIKPGKGTKHEHLGKPSGQRRRYGDWGKKKQPWQGQKETGTRLCEYPKRKAE